MDWRTCNDPERLKQLIRLQEAELELTHVKLTELVEELSAIRGEKFDVQQELAQLVSQVNEAANSDDDGSDGGKKHRNNPSRRRRNKDVFEESDTKKERSTTGPNPQVQLERRQVEIEFEEPPKCPDCDVEMRISPGDVESSEVIDSLSVQYIVNVVERSKARCPCCGHVEIAPVEQAPVIADDDETVDAASLEHKLAVLSESGIADTRRMRDGGRYSVRLAAEAATAKYADHIPLERLAAQMQRHGLEVASNTLFEQVAALAELATPTYRALFWWLQDQAAAGIDQTSWPRLDNNERDWQLWVLANHKAVFYTARPSKDLETTLEMVGHFEGTLVCDAMSSHKAAARELVTRFNLAHCWAHARGKLYDIESDFPEVGRALDLIAALFNNERAGPLGSCALGQARRTESRRLIDELKTELVRLRNESAPAETTVRRAANYALERWDELTRFLDAPQVPLHNNHVEQLIRQPVLGRKNHYGSRSQRGAHVTMVLYTLIASAKLNGLDPAKYLYLVAAAAQDRGQLGVVLPFEHDRYTRAPAPLPWETGGKRVELQHELDLEAAA